MRGDFEAYLNDDFRDESGKLDLNALLVLEDEASMDVAVVMPTPQPEPRNAELADVIRGNPRTLGCALVHPTEPEPISQVKNAAEEWGMPGIKLMPAIHNYNVDDPIVRPVVEAVRDFGLIISIHSVSSVPSRSVKSSTSAISANIREYLRNSSCSAANSSRKLVRSVSSSKSPDRLFRCHFAVKGRTT